MTEKELLTITMADDYSIYLKDTPISINDANRLLYQNDAYIAVERTYGGEERAVVVAYRNSLDTEISSIADTISEFVPGHIKLQDS